MHPDFCPCRIRLGKRSSQCDLVFIDCLDGQEIEIRQVFEILIGVECREKVCRNCFPVCGASDLDCPASGFCRFGKLRQCIFKRIDILRLDFLHVFIIGNDAEVETGSLAGGFELATQDVGLCRIDLDAFLCRDDCRSLRLKNFASVKSGCGAFSLEAVELMCHGILSIENSGDSEQHGKDCAFLHFSSCYFLVFRCPQLAAGQFVFCVFASFALHYTGKRAK